MARRTVTVHADPNDDTHKTPLEVEVPTAERPDAPVRATEYVARLNPDLGLTAVFAPGDVLPAWATQDPENPAG